MSYQQQRLLPAIAFQTRHQIAATRCRFKHLRRNPFLRKHALDVLGGAALISRRVAGIDFDQVREELHRFTSRLIAIEGRLLGQAEAGEEEDGCKDTGKTKKRLGHKRQAYKLLLALRKVEVKPGVSA